MNGTTLPLLNEWVDTVRDGHYLTVCDRRNAVKLHSATYLTLNTRCLSYTVDLESGCHTVCVIKPLHSRTLWTLKVVCVIKPLHSSTSHPNVSVLIDACIVIRMAYFTIPNITNIAYAIPGGISNINNNKLSWSTYGNM